MLRDLQVILVAVVDDLKKNPVATIVQEVVGVRKGVLDVTPINKCLPKTVQSVRLDTLEGRSVFCLELLEHKWARRSGIVWIIHLLSESREKDSVGTEDKTLGMKEGAKSDESGCAD